MDSTVQQGHTERNYSPLNKNDTHSQGEVTPTNTNDDEQAIQIGAAEVQPTFGRIMFLLCGVITFGMSFGIPTGLSIFFLDWQESFQSSRANTATVHATCIAALNIGAIVPGMLMGRIGARATLLTGCLLAFTGLVLSFFATGITFLIITTGVITGLGCSMINLPIIPCITRVFTTYQSMVIAVLSFGSGVLNTVFPYLINALSHEFSWRGASLIIGAMTFNTCVTVLVITSFLPPKSSLKMETILDVSQSHPFIESGPCSEFQSTVSLDKKVVPSVIPTGNALMLASLSSLNSRSTFGFGRNSPFGSRDTGLSEIANIVSKDKSFFSGSDHKQNTHLNKSTEMAIVTKNKRACISKLQSNYPFLVDMLYIIVAVTATYNLSALYAFIALMMDFSKNKGFPDESFSVFFVFIIFLCSMPGKLCSGLLNLIPWIHSIHILGTYGLISCFLLFLVDYIESYNALCVVFSFMGYILGGLAAIYPKCILDLPSVNENTYPLALGIVIAIEGVFDWSLPIIVASIVDHHKSYTLPLRIYGLISAVLSMLLIIWHCKVHGRDGQGRSNKIKK